MANRTVLYDKHVALGAKMVEYAGWDMPLSYPGGQIAEHIAVRSEAGLFDVSHMGRLNISGSGAVDFLQKILSLNINSVNLGRAAYAIIPNENGGAIDDAFIYRFEEGSWLLVVNAANTQSVLSHISPIADELGATIDDVTGDLAMISLQGPKSKDILFEASENLYLLPFKNSTGECDICGYPVKLSRTGYTGEPLGFELFVPADGAIKVWEALCGLGASPAGLASRDTLRLEASMPLYGHEYGQGPDGNEIPALAFSLAAASVSFSEAKGSYIGRDALKRQFEAHEKIKKEDFAGIEALGQVIRPFTATGSGIARAGDKVFLGDRHVGFVTSGTIAPYFEWEGYGINSQVTQQTKRRSIGLMLIDAECITEERFEAEIRGKRTPIALVSYHIRSDAPPYSRPIVYGWSAEKEQPKQAEYAELARDLVSNAIANHNFRQQEAINLIPSEMTLSKAVRLLSGTDPSFRYAEHRKLKSYYSEDIFYYQGTGFIQKVEELLNIELSSFLGAKAVESRALSGQMANTIAFSALTSYKNRANRKAEPKRLGYVLNNHLSFGGHLSAQPMGALKDFIAFDPNTDRRALVNIPVRRDNPYKPDIEQTKALIEQYRPELIIFGKSMILYKEPVSEIREFIDSIGLDAFIMYDMAHVLGLYGPYFQEPLKEGANLVTASTHKTFYGTQRGLLAGNFESDDLLWEEIQSRAFPGATSNHHLGTMLGLLMASYEMNAFKDTYPKAVISNARSFAASLADAGFGVEGDPADGYTETHQAIVRVGYSKGIEIAERLEANGIITNFQQTPAEEGFSASGGLRMGTSEMTRFGFGPEQFGELAELMADCVLHGKNVRSAVAKLRSQFTDMRYCLDESVGADMLESLRSLY
ncbi:MAG: glycine cleavage system aminomethyltransferase GcvT [Eubacteriaceae bacterium]|nr:glycine cleavage system aminomethyltransferase GcvT [Eubacteriaceae bacterium]